jgi:outer membrane protein OmpA-like peptidoglycan-associated protein
MNTLTHLKPAVITLAILAALSGCSTAPESNARLEEARGSYRMAKDNPRNADMAAAEMQQATKAMDVANSAWERKESTESVNHWAYLAKQRIAIAQATTERKVAELSVAQAKANSDELRLSARTQEADSATAKAALSEQQAEAAKQQAEASKTQATTAQMMALSAQERANDLEARLRDLDAKKTERGMVMTMGDVLFDTNQSQLRAGGERSVDKLASFLTTYPDRVVLIEGFTDSTGSDSHNQDLSLRRANAVRDALLLRGVATQRLTTQGHGEGSPVASNDNASGRQMNRRVEVLLSDESGKISSR